LKLERPMPIGPDVQLQTLLEESRNGYVNLS
jgi:hypothetical protein